VPYGGQPLATFRRQLRFVNDLFDLYSFYGRVEKEKFSNGEPAHLKKEKKKKKSPSLCDQFNEAALVTLTVSLPWRN